MLRFLTRHQINDLAWDDCVAGAHNALVYGHAWYLDAVTNLPNWRWEGLVLQNVPDTEVGSEFSGKYTAVLPIPLRRRWGRWVVYQPLFCQFFAIFSRQSLDLTPFIEAVYARHRHALTWHLLLNTPIPGLPPPVRQQVLYTHVLELGEGQMPYTPDRRMNLRRATRRIADVPDWQVVMESDCEPLLTLFRENHADEIGVGSWAYILFRGVFEALQRQGLGTLQYAWAGGEIVAGALFVAQHGRIIYLFNAANAEGRRLNARSLLIDGMIQTEQKKATTKSGPMPLLLDFESPEKPGVVAFYESFGATAHPYIRLSWSRSTWPEQLARRLLKAVRR